MGLPDHRFAHALSGGKDFLGRGHIHHQAHLVNAHGVGQGFLGLLQALHHTVVGDMGG
jgi:hypothetical protein